ncbi:MAG: Hpt domain-containing protein [Deltaproteobacteria bacterium]|nr:Hpt domain-containing protein [Deltaproteobacteria bacterium]
MTIHISKEQLLENFMDDEELLLESVDLFLSRVEGRYKDLDEAVKAKNEQTVMETGHTIKGMVAIFETGEAFEAAKILEFMGRNKNLDGVDEALKDFRVKLDELCQYLTDLKKEFEG